MELISEKFRVFECTIADFDRIMTIHKSRPAIHGNKKNEFYNEYIEKYVADILLGEITNTKIVACESNATKQMMSYSIYFYPTASDSVFILFGEYIKEENNDFLQSGIHFLFKAATLDAASQGRFNTYWATQLTAFLPAIKLSRESHLQENESVLDWYLHKVVQPTDQLVGSIEKTLLGSLPLARKNPVAIIHLVTKMKYRLDYFENSGLNNNILKKYFN